MPLTYAMNIGFPHRVVVVVQYMYIKMEAFKGHKQRQTNAVARNLIFVFSLAGRVHLRIKAVYTNNNTQPPKLKYIIISRCCFNPLHLYLIWECLGLFPNFSHWHRLRFMGSSVIKTKINVPDRLEIDWRQQSYRTAISNSAWQNHSQ